MPRSRGPGLRFRRPDEGTTHWVEQLRSAHLSVGTYSIAAGGTDDQVPHTEDEVYVVAGGRRRAWRTPSGDSIPVDGRSRRVRPRR